MSEIHRSSSEHNKPEKPKLPLEVEPRRRPQVTRALPGDLMITVCFYCLRASCFQGAYHCDLYQGAQSVDLTVRTLDSLKLENPSYFDSDENAREWRNKAEFSCLENGGKV